MASSLLRNTMMQHFAELHFILICMLCENVENNPQYYEFKYSHYCDNGLKDIKSAYHKLNEYTCYMAINKSANSKILLQNFLINNIQPYI